MELNDILIILIIMCFLKIIYNWHFKVQEGFFTSNIVNQQSAFSIFYDQQFKNTKYYDNDGVFKNTLYYENDEQGINGQKGLLTGWEKCKLSCPGSCLEYMVSGRAWCFLPKKPEDNRYGDEFSGKSEYQQENTNKTSKQGDLAT